MATMPLLAILLVEDDAALGDALFQCLFDQGHVLTLVATSRDARIALAASTFDVAIVDLNMYSEGETTEGLLEELSVAADGAPRAVLMSASPRAPAVARRFGIPLLVKPFDFDALDDAIARACRPVTSRASRPAADAAKLGDTAPSRRA